ncbi:transposase, partial [Macrococcus brunensis]
MIRPDSQKINSNYLDLYDIVVPKNNKLRRMKDIIDFSFIYDEVIENYSITKGRSAVSPVRMFKYLLLKVIFDLSDVDVVERSRYDMSFKFFLDMAPEEEVIHSS